MHIVKPVAKMPHYTSANLQIMKNNVLITGFMGVGKSRTARALAAATGLFAVDTDDLIESLAHCSVSAIFAKQGEAAFRCLEQDVADWLASSVDKTIVSTGGGFFMVRNLMDLGHVFYLHADFDAIHQRLLAQPGGQHIAKRPLFQDLDQARKRYHDRLPHYRQKAHHIIETKGRESSAIALHIKDILLDQQLLAQP